MRRFVLPLLIAANAIFAATLVSMWVTPKGQWRNVLWQAPEAKDADVSSGLPSATQTLAIENSRVVVLMDRPLFALTRRPPPPPPPPPVAAPPDTLSSARVVAVYAGPGGGGVVLNLGGKSRRVRLNENVDGWTLQSIDGRSATFTSSGQSRALQLGRAALTTSSGGQPLSFVAAPPPASQPEPAPRPPRATSRGPVFGGS